MGIKQKSKCQLRLEARGAGCTHDPQQLAARLQSRIQRANELRAFRTRQLAARAGARVLHAQDVARGIRAKRREETRRSKQSAVARQDEAARRRHEALEQLQQQCKQRTDQVMEKVELVRADAHDKADRARRSLTDQLDEAARRREEQKQQRVQRLTARWQSVESVKDRVGSAKFIQRWFRRLVAARATAKALRAAQKDVQVVVKSWTHMRSASFEDCMGILQERPVVMAAQRLLKVLLANGSDPKKTVKVTSPGKKTPPGSPNSVISFRILLMAGMIASHPNEIMGNDPSQRLHFAAEVILADMENLARCLADLDGVQGASEMMKCVSRLSARFAFYMEAFARWKARDAERLAAELLTSYRELWIVHQKYEEQAREAHDGVDGVHELLHQTRGQLQQMERALERLLGREGAKEKVQELQQSLRQETGSNGDAEQKQDDDDEEMQESSDEHSNSGPTDVSQVLMADRKLVHELILNPHFQIPRDREVEASAAAVASQQSVAALAVRVREAMTKAFWDRVVEANDIETLLARTEELRVSFRDALGGGSGAGLGSGLSVLADQVDAALQSEQLRELMQDPMGNVRIIEARCNAVLDAFERAEAPARAESTRTFRVEWMQRVAAGAMTPVLLLVEFLAFSLDKVDELRNDVLNAHLGLLGTYLQRHGVEYEQKLLQARLAESSSSFAMTEKWLSLELPTYLARPEADEAERARLLRYDGSAFERFVRVSTWALVEKHIDGAASRAWPETFEFDVDRVRSCRDALDRITIVSSVLALVQEFVARRNLTAPAGFIPTVGQQLSNLLRSPGITGSHLVAQAVQDVRQMEGSSEEAEQQLAALEKRLHGSFAAGNPVFSLFFSRASRAFEAALLAVDGASGVDLHPSLAPFAAEIGEATANLRRLAQHNESVYASLYNRIIKRLLSAL